VVENRPGAGNNIATEAVVRAPADGYTLMLVGPPAAINATLYEKLNFNFIRDIAPVATIMRAANVMEVNPAFSAKTVPEFIAYAKANPGAPSSSCNRRTTRVICRTPNGWRCIRSVPSALVPTTSLLPFRRRKTGKPRVSTPLSAPSAPITLTMTLRPHNSTPSWRRSRNWDAASPSSKPTTRRTTSP
jgi:hypothetical protein